MRSGLWVTAARKAFWLTYCKILADVVGYPGTFGILHLKYYVAGHTKSSPCILYSMVIGMYVSICLDPVISRCEEELLLFGFELILKSFEQKKNMNPALK